ncbi:VOC family protein [Lentisphaerota bacterium ZTH]|nr:VOC family protein [Lentisphaerota bacterium]WET06980.1 VOC family protein [Lentisphaerota bacterium ZTH]
MTSLLHSLLILPVPDLIKTSEFYENNLGFRPVRYLNSKQPHICLYRDFVEIILLQSKLKEIKPNRILHGYGYDGYFTGRDIKTIYTKMVYKKIEIIKPLEVTDYGNLEFVFEDVDGRWIAIGCKQN